jgi:hypothetical protein
MPSFYNKYSLPSPQHLFFLIHSPPQAFVDSCHPFGGLLSFKFPLFTILYLLVKQDHVDRASN